MKTDVAYNPETNTVNAVVQGSVTSAGALEIAKIALGLTRQHECNLLYDLREAVFQAVPEEVICVQLELKASFPKPEKTAIVEPKEPFPVNFYTFVAEKSGRNIQTFSEAEEAREWLDKG